MPENLLIKLNYFVSSGEKAVLAWYWFPNQLRRRPCNTSKKSCFSQEIPFQHDRFLLHPLTKCRECMIEILNLNFSLGFFFHIPYLVSTSSAPGTYLLSSCPRPPVCSSTVRTKIRTKIKINNFFFFIHATSPVVVLMYFGHAKKHVLRLLCAVVDSTTAHNSVHYSKTYLYLFQLHGQSNSSAVQIFDSTISQPTKTRTSRGYIMRRRISRPHHFCTL